MKSAFPGLLLILSFFYASLSRGQVLPAHVDIASFGAIGDGRTLNTAAINKAIAACSEAGGGIVNVPEGNFLTGTIFLQNNVTLHLNQDAHIMGTTDLGQYKSFRLKHFDPAQPINITVRDSASWCKTLVMLDSVHDVAITGTGTIDGGGVLNKLGEEGHRGPHGIYIGDAKNVFISGIRLMRSGNYNILGLYVENLTITGITISQGADGIHIRQGKNIVIDNCKCFTADDCVAGGYWQHMLIRDCLLNSSCNGIRVILPVKGLEIEDCQIFGPGVFGHPRGTPSNPLITRTLTGIILQPGAWGLGPGNLENVYIHDIRIRDMQTALTFVLNKGNQGSNIKTENLVATGITGNACSVEAWPDNSSFSHVQFKNITVSYQIADTSVFSIRNFERPRTESRPLPYWGFYLRRVKDIRLENVLVTYAGREVRPVMGFDQVDSAWLKNVHYTAVPGMAPFKYDKTIKLSTDNVGPARQ